MNRKLTLTQWQTRVNETFSMIVNCRMTSDKAIEYWHKTVFSELNRCYNKYTQPSKRNVYDTFTRGFVYGLEAAAMHRIWDHVEFCYIVDGVIYSTHKTSQHPTVEHFYNEGKGYTMVDRPSAHFWKGTDKPYTKVSNPILKGK